MSLYNNRSYGDRSFSSLSQGSLSLRPSPFRASVGYQPGMQRAMSGLNLSRNGPLPLSSSTFLLSSLPNLEIDPKLHQIRSMEKEQIKGLNNQFVSFISKVRELERQNKILETQLRLLKEKDSYKSNMNQIMSVSSNTLKQQIDSLMHEKEKLEAELANMEALLEDLRNRYEEEINRRNQLENDFVLTKKDLDDTYLQKVDMESKLDSTSDEIDYLKQLFQEEIQELQSQVHNTQITVEMDNGRDLEMKHIMDEVKEQYQVMTDKSRQEAERWYKSKLDDMANQAKRNSDELKNMKTEISELNRQLQRTNGDIDALKTQRANLENAIGVAEDQGEQAVRNTKKNIQELEDALKRAKQDMAGKVREYQDLMNTKLALDIEIATYRKLLEGEETRMVNPMQIQQFSGPKQNQQFSGPMQNQQFNGPMQNQQLSAIDRLAASQMHDYQPVSATTTTTVSSGYSAPAKKPVMIKTIETVNGRRLSEASHYSED